MFLGPKRPSGRVCCIQDNVERWAVEERECCFEEGCECDSGGDDLVA